MGSFIHKVYTGLALYLLNFSLIFYPAWVWTVCFTVFICLICSTTCAWYVWASNRCYYSVIDRSQERCIYLPWRIFSRNVVWYPLATKVDHFIKLLIISCDLMRISSTYLHPLKCIQNLVRNIFKLYLSGRFSNKFPSFRLQKRLSLCICVTPVEFVRASLHLS